MYIYIYIYILEINQYIKSDEILYIIYAELESLIEKVDGLSNNAEKFSTKNIGRNVFCKYSI